MREITSVEIYDFIMQPYETIPRIKLRKNNASVQNLLQYTKHIKQNILNSYTVTTSLLYPQQSSDAGLIQNLSGPHVARGPQVPHPWSKVTLLKI